MAFGTATVPIGATGAPKFFQCGRNLLTPLFKTCNDKLWMRDNHLINFISCDHPLTTPIGRELIEHSILKISDLNKEELRLNWLRLNYPNCVHWHVFYFM